MLQALRLLSLTRPRMEFQSSSPIQAYQSGKTPVTLRNTCEAFTVYNDAREKWIQDGLHPVPSFLCATGL